jgi:carboxylesterase
LRDDTDKRLAIASDGIIPGAEAFELRAGGGAPAILLLHGSGDTPQTLRYLADFLNRRGYNVRVPLLPGHGRTVREFSSATAEAWLDSARGAYRELSAIHEWVAVAGLSMGGALAVQLAAEDDAMPALVLLAPYLAMPPRVALAVRFSKLWEFAVPYLRALDPKAPRSIHDAEESSRSLAYGVFTPAALRALRRTVVRAVSALPLVETPTLMVHSREDNRVPAYAAQREFDRIGSIDKRLVWLTGTGHVITVDYGRERVFELVADWFDQHRVAAPRQRRA